MTPTLIAAPIAQLVDVADAKAHCRVDHCEDDATIEAMIGAAVGHLDGWTGILGRCIMPQTWRVSVAKGAAVLPMPDVVTASGAYEAGPQDLAITASSAGPMVTVTEDCDVTFSCAMPAALLPTVRVAVLLLVGHWYSNREAAAVAMAETPLSVDMLVSQMRWRRF